MGIMDKVKDAMPGHHSNQQGTRAGQGDEFDRPGNDNFNNPTYSSTATGGMPNTGMGMGMNTNTTERGSSFESSRDSDTYGSPKDTMRNFNDDADAGTNVGMGMGGNRNTSMPTGPSGYGDTNATMGQMGEFSESTELAGQKRMGGVTGEEMGERAGMGMTQDMGSGMMGGLGTRGDMTGDDYNNANTGTGMGMAMGMGQGNRNLPSGYTQTQGYNQSQADY